VKSPPATWSNAMGPLFLLIAREDFFGTLRLGSRFFWAAAIL
jgi:hypothetical protein